MFSSLRICCFIKLSTNLKKMRFALVTFYSHTSTSSHIEQLNFDNEISYTIWHILIFVNLTVYSQLTL